MELDSDSDFKLQLNVSLESLAAVAAAIHLWEAPDVQKEIQNYFSNPSEDLWEYHSKWSDVHDKVADRVTALNLPDKNVIELYHLMGLIGDKIFCWYEYVMLDLELDSKFAGKIYWTCQAGIDEGKIFQQFWQYEPDFHSSKQCINGLGSSLFMVACLFWQEDFIEKNLEEMKNKINECLEPKIENSNISEITDAWLRFYFRLPKEVNEDNRSKLFFVSMSTCTNMVFKFLMNKYNPIGIERLYAIVAVISLGKKELSRYKKEKLVDIILFLWNKMSIDIQNLFLELSIKSIVKGFLHVWPYQPFILNFVAKIASSSLEEIYPHWLMYIIQLENLRKWPVPELYSNIYHWIFIKILKMIPKDLKQEILLSSEYHICTDAFDYHNDKVLCFILNDPDMLHLRDEIISNGEKHFKKHLELFEFNEFDECMEKLKLSEIEKRSLKSKCNTLLDAPIMSYYILDGSFEKLDQLLIWLSDGSECKKTNLKTNIDSYEIVLTVLETEVYADRDLTTLNQYLSWQFDSELERTDFKSKLDLFDVYRNVIARECESGSFNFAFIYDLLNWQFDLNVEEKLKEIKGQIIESDVTFMCDQICMLWNLNFFTLGEECARGEVLKFLSWLFESVEAISDGLKKVINLDRFAVRFCISFENENKEKATEAVHKFLQFCNATNERMNEVKQEVMNYFLD